MDSRLQEDSIIFDILSTDEDDFDAAVENDASASRSGADKKTDDGHGHDVEAMERELASLLGPDLDALERAAAASDAWHDGAPEASASSAQDVAATEFEPSSHSDAGDSAEQSWPLAAVDRENVPSDQVSVEVDVWTAIAEAPSAGIDAPAPRSDAAQFDLPSAAGEAQADDARPEDKDLLAGLDLTAIELWDSGDAETCALPQVGDEAAADAASPSGDHSQDEEEAERSAEPEDDVLLALDLAADDLADDLRAHDLRADAPADETDVDHAVSADAVADAWSQAGDHPQLEEQDERSVERDDDVLQALDITADDLRADAADGDDAVSTGEDGGEEAQVPGLPPEAEAFGLAIDEEEIATEGFETAVRRAAGAAEARFLFQMPVHTVADCTRVAAVSLSGEEAPVTLLVLLEEDGRSIRMEDASASDNPFAGMAVSYGGLLAHLKSLPTRAAA